ncbi:O-antigen ligase family protein [Formosa sp. 4Alg 33]|uniref:O-antigen ligase family protein n=1 Tax=Formosa sp. 4Alg 33 TaxID=3382189 RepID=UPI003D9C283B
MNYLKQIYAGLACLLCASLPFENIARIVPNIVLGLLLLLSPFIIKKRDLKTIITPPKIIVYIFILYLLLRSVFIDDNSLDFKLISKIVAIIPLFIVFSISKHKIFILKSFIIGVLLCILICAYSIIKYVINTRGFDFSNGDIIYEILIIERLYLGFLCAVSFGFSIVIYEQSKFKRVVLFNMLICFLFVGFISARIGLITILFIGVLFLFRLFKFKKAIVGVLAILVLVISVFQLNDNLKNRFLYAEDTHDSYFYKLREWEPRVVIWECSYSILKGEHNRFLGDGQLDIKQKLNACYASNIEKEIRKNWFLERQYNTHNQFIDILLSYGYVGLFLFLSIFIITFMYSKHRFQAFILLSVLILFGLVENFFHRQIGVYIFSLVLIQISWLDINTLKLSNNEK